jgi:NAD(P)-dependent dehydrogenase (short-subunit alcohol dehydrogenase family)
MEKNPEEKMIKFLKEKSLKPDVLINNARNSEYNKIDKDGRITEDNFLDEYKAEVYIPYLLSMELSDEFNSLNNIINIASMYGVVVPTPSLYNDFEHQSPINYGVTKAALIHLTKELSVRLSHKNIRVNAISYGGVEGRVDEAFKKRYARLCPMRRMLKEDEITGPLGYLISDASVGMTGHNLIVDGGWSVW